MILIFAIRNIEACHFARQKGFNNKDWKYVGSADALRGILSTDLYVLSDARSHRNFDEVILMAKTRFMNIIYE